MKLNKDIEERPPRSQQYYNRVYLGLIAGLFLVCSPKGVWNSSGI